MMSSIFYLIDIKWFELINEINKYKGSTSLNFREKLSRIAFSETAYYDSIISEYLNKLSNIEFPKKKYFMET